MPLPGAGLIKGLGVTLKTMTRRSVTRQYPDVKPALPPRTRGVIALLEENCTVCMLCSRECPDWCIYIDSHKETVPPKEPGARARTRNMLDRFAIDFSLCMYCGICIEVCPFDALFWSPEFEYAEFDIREMTHEKDRLREWMYTVPAPPALDPDGDVAPEVTAAAKVEPRLVETAPLFGAPIAVAQASVVAAPAAVETASPDPATTDTAAGGAGAPAQAEEAGGGAPAGEASTDIGEVQVDQEAYDAAIAAGHPDRVARAKAKSAWVKKARKAAG